MSLHFILGGSGSGKSTWLFKKIQKDASENPSINYLVLVPDQFTLETQKTLVSLNGNKGILIKCRIIYECIAAVNLK